MPWNFSIIVRDGNVDIKVNRYQKVRSIWTVDIQANIKNIIGTKNNVQVMERLQKEKDIITTIKKRKLQYLVHKMRREKYSLLQLIIQGKNNGKTRIVNWRYFWLKNPKRYN